MAEAALNDLYQCAVCLDQLKDPATIPCGHNYCQRCISSCWNQGAQTGVYSCPQCRETFSPRPALKKNTVLADLIDQLRIAETQDSSSGHCFAGPGDVECDACTERKLKAVKSCLMCLASFCETHVQPHYKSPAFKKHDLMDASAHLQEKICCQHGRLLEMFCRTDQTCVCMLCTINEHRGHDTVSITAESNEKKITLQEVKKTSLQQIQEREKNLRELTNALACYELSADAAVQHSEMIFGELLKFIKTKGTEVNEMIRDQQGAAVSQAEPVIKCLEEEIAELRQGQDALEQLSREEDHVQFLQSFKAVLPTLKATHLPSMAGSPSLSFNDPSGSLSLLKQEVEEVCKRFMVEITTRFKEPLNEPLLANQRFQYDREFLLGFQFMPACVQKPEGLPHIDVVMDNITQNKFPNLPPDSSIISMCQQSQPILGGSGNTDDIQLRVAENPWEPSMMREVGSDDPEALKTEELLCKMQSILDKLTRQKFQQLMKQVSKLTINTEERLKGVINLIFEKAISEPSMCVTYANMCRCLATLKVPLRDNPNTTVNFRKLLLNRCQKEFERTLPTTWCWSACRDSWTRPHRPVSGSLQEELEEDEDEARRRSIGNIRFIGELFKLKMLTEPIMHDCVVTLLQNRDEEALECLCCLLTTIGKDLDFEKAKPRMDQYFNKMERIVKERETSSQIRFMLQDVINLRRHNWVKIGAKSKEQQLVKKGGKRRSGAGHSGFAEGQLHHHPFQPSPYWAAGHSLSGSFYIDQPAQHSVFLSADDFSSPLWPSPQNLFDDFDFIVLD
ncbi:hypothetical protein ACEWY4_012970 [Coilia grayii]|uniref:Uncharacterized protein n=1 Tax=Coilia grayii TaxID=363190 RepID=A0ABD1JV32_9TELE